MKIEIKNYQGRLYLTVSNRIQQERVVMWTLLKAQCNIIANKKEFIFTFMIMMLCIAVNHMNNVVTYYGSELSEMVAFPEISLLGCNNIASYYFFKLYPFILVIPAGFSVPLFFEVILNVISFPMDAHGNLSKSLQEYPSLYRLGMNCAKPCPDNILQKNRLR